MSLASTREGRIAVEDVLLLAAVVALPWAIGGVELWSYRLASAWVAAAAAVALARRGFSALGDPRDLRWLLPALLLGALALAQTIPMPPAVVAAVSPSAARIHAEAWTGYPGPPPADPAAAIEAEALARVPEVGGRLAGESGADLNGLDAGRRRWPTLSLYPDGTMERLCWYVALLLAFLLTWNRTRHAHRSRIYRRVLQGALVALAVVGLLQSAAWNGKLLWFIPVGSRGRAVGPYINPDHFAVLMEIAILWLAGEALQRLRRPGARFVPTAGLVMSAAAAAICLVAAVGAASKMATLLIALALAALAFLGRRTFGARVAASVAVAAVLGAVLLVSGRSELAERTRSFVQSSAGGVLSGDRILVAKACVRMIEDFPLAGSGFGAFRYVFPRYLQRGESETWLQAHDDWLEVVVGGGALALGLLLWVTWGYWSRAVRAVRHDARRGQFSWLGLVLGLGAVAVHGLVDFGLQIPANALLYVTAAALVLGHGVRAAERRS